MEVHVSDDTVEVRLAPWQKVLGLMGDIRVARSDVYDAAVIEDGVRDAMRDGAWLKAGLRLPWIAYVCRSLRLDRVWVVRRGMPALTFSVRGDGHLRQVTVSSRDAASLAAK